MQTDLCTMSRSTLAAGQWNSQGLLFSNDKDIIGRIHGKEPELEGEWRDTPPLDRLCTRDWWETMEGDTTNIPYVAESDEVPAKSREVYSVGWFLGQPVNRLLHPPCIGPLAFMFFVCSSALSEIAGGARVLD